MRAAVRIVVAFAAASLILVVEGSSSIAGTGNDPADCASCHTREYQEWSGSAHARAATTDAFRLLAEAASGVPGTWSTESCLHCHNPLRGSDSQGAAGVTCQACHLIASVEGSGNGGFHFAADGILRGVGESQSPHETLASTLLSESLFCAACHEQYHPDTGIPFQSTYSEWRNTLALSEGQACQDCHMRSVSGVSHSFMAGTPDSAAKAEALGGAVAMTVEAPGFVHAGRPVVVTVRLQNTGAGHALPTGKNVGREKWLEMTAVGSDGTVLHSEALPYYGVVYNDSDGKHEAFLSLLDAATIFADHRLVPGQVVAERFAFAVPVEARTRFTVSVALKYRPVPAWLSERLGIPLADAVSAQDTSLDVLVLESLPVPTYVPPTQEPTPAPQPTIAGGVETGGAQAGEENWIAPFLVVGGALLVAVTFWALRRRQV